jgi:hypothetical protein
MYYYTKSYCGGGAQFYVLIWGIKVVS